jgi:hypothetical protein
MARDASSRKTFMLSLPLTPLIYRDGTMLEELVHTIMALSALLAVTSVVGNARVGWDGHSQRISGR